jgi:CDP-diacylglycerol--serine O-phosphatidyltransferase
MDGRVRLRRGIYLLPTLFTIANMFCGYASVVQSSIDNLELAAMLIIVAAALDGLDGRIARLTGSTSDFGLEFDSLADIVSFGMAPALLAYHWALGPSHVGWSVAFVYIVCAAMRLARYNIQKTGLDRRHFVGLPSPMAGSVLACIVFAFPEPARSTWLGSAVATLVACVAVLMISRVRYRSFREIDLRNRRSYVWALPIAAVMIAVAFHPKAMLLLLCTVYLLSGPVSYLASLVRNRRTAQRSAAAGVVDESALR